MTCYLAQSVVWALAFTPFLLDLVRHADRRHHRAAGDRDLGWPRWRSPTGCARAGRRGPFEVLVRRVTYGNRGADVDVVRT